LLEIMRSDKKTRGGKLRFVLPRAIGKVETVAGISRDLVRDVLSALGKRR
jgi:3-dehydroquinate synthetase